MLSNLDKATIIFGEYPIVCDGVQLPIPRSNSYDVGREPISTSNTKRANAMNAKMHKKTMAVKAVVTIDYVDLDTKEFAKMYANFGMEDLSKEFVTLKYFDPFLDRVETRRFYIPGINTKVTKTSLDKKKKYVTTTIEFIEE